MSAQPVVLAAASYPSRATAEHDFWAVAAIKRHGPLDQLAAAVVEKGANGWLEIVRHHSTALPLGWGVALLGSAITVVAAPLGIAFLAPVLTTAQNGKEPPPSLVAFGTKSPETGFALWAICSRPDRRVSSSSPLITAQNTSRRSCPMRPPRS